MKLKTSLLSLCCLIASQVIAVEKPNILFILADDHEYKALGLMSDGYVQTPAIDKLAKEGVYFERAYNMGAWVPAVCLSSRTMLMTGKSLYNAEALCKTASKASKNGKDFDWDKSQMPLMWTERMKESGYQTYFTGKWHFKGYKPEELFDSCGTERGGMPMGKGGKNRPIEGESDAWSASDPSFGGYWKGGKHWSEVVADETVAYLKEYGETKPENPFFAYISFNAPHDPRQSPQEYLDKYPVESVPLPDSFMPSYPYTKEIGILGIRAESLAPRPRTEFAIKTHRREYYALVTHMDDQIARVIAEVDKQGLRENTIIIYTADHGLSLGNHSFFAKQSMYDHSLAAPFIILGPGMPKGVRSSQRIYVQDVVPTTLELAGASEKNRVGIEFDSLLPLGDKGTKNEREPIYGAFRDFSRCVISDNWKLVYYPPVKKFRLFNLENDPAELKDLIDNPEYTQKVQGLLKLLVAEQKKFNDKTMFEEVQTYIK